MIRWVEVKVEGPDEHGSMYITLQPDARDRKGVIQTTQKIQTALVDYDADGDIYGIELLGVPKPI